MTKNIKTLLFLLLTAANFNISAQVAASQKRRIDYVNPFVGTQNMGHTFPGAVAPFGFVQLSPDTEEVWHNIEGVYQPLTYRYCAGYQHDDPTIIGFSHTHFSGTGHSDLGDILIMPMVGPVKLVKGTADEPETGYRSRFRNETEKAWPGYYSVMLDDYNIKAELTATKRCGVHRYTFPKGEGHIILDLMYGIYNYDGKVLMANLRVEDEYTLTGYRITRGWSRMNYTHFAIKFSKPIKNYGSRNFENVLYRGFWRRFNMEDNFPEMFGRNLVAYFTFDFEHDDDYLEIQVCLSPVDMLGAMGNLKAEVYGRSFDEIRKEAEEKWERELSVIDVVADEERKAIFYTALYRTMIHPSIFQDVDGRYRGIDHNIHTAAEGRTNYTVFSLWDTFRAQHPLLHIIKREYSEQFLASMLDHYRQSVHRALPVWSHHGNENWCMIGYHAVAVLADAMAKGLNFDKDLALKASINSSNLSYFNNIGDYVRYGFVPMANSPYSASKTLEYAYNDWTIYQMAKRMNRMDIAEEYAKRSQNFRNIFCPKINFARPRDVEGNFQEPFSLLETNRQGFIEGNTWNYSFFVPHDVPALIELMGGEKRFIERLDSLFTMELPEEYYAHQEDITIEGLMGNYVHGNEPSHHVPYLYVWTSEPWKTQSRVRKIMDQMYKNAPDGLCGNDDAGQMSAWYIFSAMGFYPVCPGSDQYALGSPNAEKITLNLENGNKFTIKAKNFSSENVYVSSITLNGKPHTSFFISHADIMNGGELVFELSDKTTRR
jgi:predicted alpha-1,2-mannosidase